MATMALTILRETWSRETLTRFWSNRVAISLPLPSTILVRCGRASVLSSSGSSSIDSATLLAVKPSTPAKGTIKPEATTPSTMETISITPRWESTRDAEGRSERGLAMARRIREGSTGAQSASRTPRADMVRSD